MVPPAFDPAPDLPCPLDRRVGPHEIERGQGMLNQHRCKCQCPLHGVPANLRCPRLSLGVLRTMKQARDPGGYPWEFSRPVLDVLIPATIKHPRLDLSRELLPFMGRRFSESQNV